MAISLLHTVAYLTVVLTYPSRFCFFPFFFQSRVRDCSPASPLHLLCSWFFAEEGLRCVKAVIRHLAAAIHFSPVYIPIYFFFLRARSSALYASALFRFTLLSHEESKAYLPFLALRHISFGNLKTFRPFGFFNFE
ncbi:hypothetical protein GGI43DRAFT_153809 [Trichoderma evansii]